MTGTIDDERYEVSRLASSSPQSGTSSHRPRPLIHEPRCRNRGALYTMSPITVSNTPKTSDGDAALTDTHTARVHAIARAVFYYLAPVFASECRHPCCPSGLGTLKGLQEVVMKRSIVVVIAADVDDDELSPGPLPGWRRIMS